MLKRIACVICIIVMIPATLSGCWDKVEIDQRGFVTVLMVDMAPAGGAEKSGEEEKSMQGAEQQEGKLLKVTYRIANSRLLAGEGGGGGGDKAAISMSSNSESINKASRLVDSRLSRRIYFGHTQVIILGESLLKDTQKFKEVLGDFERGQQFTRTMRMLAAEGEASKAGDLDPKGEKLLFRYLRGILENESTNGRIIDMNYNDFISMLRAGDGSGVIPKVNILKDEAKVAGFYVLKDYKMAGSLTDSDARYYNTLSGRRKGGVIFVSMGDASASFTTNNISRKLKLANADPNNLEVDIVVEDEGSISEVSVEKSIFDTNLLDNMESQINKSEEEKCKSVIDKLQKEYKVDALQIGEFLRKYHPDVWDKVKDKWNDVYPNVKIVPVYNSRIRRVGTAK